MGRKGVGVVHGSRVKTDFSRITHNSAFDISFPHIVLQNRGVYHYCIHMK